VTDDSYDVVAVGGGAGGLVAAITASDLGLRAVVVEKTALLGGVTSYSQGQFWLAASDEAKSAGIADSEAAGARYLVRLGMGFADPDLAAAYSALAPRVCRFLSERAGVRWRLVDLADYYFPTFDEALPTGRYLEVEPILGAELGDLRDRLRVSPHVPYRLSHKEIYALPCGARSHTWDPAIIAQRAARDELALGTGFMAYLVKAAADLGVTFLTNAEVASLEICDGRVSGVLLGGERSGRRIGAARGVVLATGGYDWHKHLARSFETNTGMTSAAPPSVVGDHLRLATAAGARLSQNPKPIRLSIPVPGDDDGRPMSRIIGAMAVPHAVLVNRHGRRFGDESFYPSIGHALKEIDGSVQELRNVPCWIVFDAQFRRRYSFGTVCPNDDFPVAWGVVQADSLAELSDRTGIDAAGLASEIGRFNQFCAAQQDTDFGRGERPWAQLNYGDREIDGNPCLGTLAEAPFFAFRPGFVGAGIAAMGVATDRNGRALGYDSEPIPGLYVVGNSATLNEVGAGYQSGVANTRAAVFAFAAVRHAAGMDLADDEFIPAP
jgi:3-oxosteroid 1-dehydrogenase